MASSGQHFSMFREYSVADVLTLGNAACGTGSLFCCLHYLAEGDVAALWTAFALLPVAFVLDALDGWVARKLRRGSRLGADLDSLADIVSFGIAPAALAYTLGMRSAIDVAILIYFVCCGISRLARFNVTSAELADQSTGKVKYFEGTPIPTSLVVVAVLAVAVAQGATGSALWLGHVEVGPLGWHPLTLLYFVSGSAMISGSMRIPKP